MSKQPLPRPHPLPHSYLFMCEEKAAKEVLLATAKCTASKQGQCFHLDLLCEIDSKAGTWGP